MKACGIASGTVLMLQMVRTFFHGSSMTARALLATIAGLIVFATSSFAAAPDGDGGATVLCYHIVESPQDPRMEISRETFLQQMRYLAMTGYTVIPLREAYEYAVGKRGSLPRNAVVVTIDDGWRSTYTEVFPEMKRRKFPFTIFIYPKIIGQTGYALTWKQVKEMSDAGVDIQSHSLSHPFLTQRRHSALAEAPYQQWLQNELAESRRILKKETGKDVQFLAYPYGDYDHRVAAASARAGYAGALTCDFGRVRKGSDPLRMKRVVVDKKMDFASFRHYLGAGAMHLEEMTPLPGQVVDLAPETVIVSARIPNHKSVDPKSVGMTLMSAAGLSVPFIYDPASGSIALTIKDAKEALKNKVQRALVWATDSKSGRRIEASWTFRLPAPPPAAPLPPPAGSVATSEPATAPAAVPAAVPAAAAAPHHDDARAKVLRVPSPK
jgi:peptidoglycan/xylan/chitin deacetylase (PgdA/CDA1 family)